jgi:hypothetical protein
MYFFGLLGFSSAWYILLSSQVCCHLGSSSFGLYLFIGVHIVSKILSVISCVDLNDRITIMTKRRVGTIIVPPGVFVDRHEKIAVDFLAVSIGYDVTFLLPNRSKGAKTPDIEMNGLLWEIKSPKGKSPLTIENNLRLALLQSPNVVIDLRRMDGRIPTYKLLREVERQFELAKSIKRLIVITRQEERIDLER